MTNGRHHPIQPLVEKNGVLRFQENAIVRYLLDYATAHGCGLNELATMRFCADDRRQLAQLIDYSLSWYGDLSYVDAEAFNAAEQSAHTEGNPQ